MPMISVDDLLRREVGRARGWRFRPWIVVAIALLSMALVRLV